MHTVPARFERWLRSARGATAAADSHVGCVVSEFPDPGRATPFRWISHADPPFPSHLPLTVDLWVLRQATVTRAVFGELCAGLELANCRYDEIAEGFVVRGFVVSRLIVLRANLVAPSVEQDSFLAEAAQSGSRVRLWTYSASPRDFEVFPHCPAPIPDVGRPFGALAELLSKLSGPAKRGDRRDLPAGLPVDRRRFERQPVRLRASVGIAGAGRRIVAERRATISDLSARGACLTDFTLRTGLGALRSGRVVLRSTVGGRSFLARGSVVRISVQRKSTSLGIEFTGRPRMEETKGEEVRFS